MQKAKRLTALLLALTMAAGLTLGGCQAKEAPKTTESKTDSKTESKTDTTATDGDRKMEGNMYLEGLPLVKDQETFSLLIDDGHKVDDIQDWPMVKMLTDQTNVKVDWQVFPYEVAAEKKNLLLSTGDYPDMMGGWLIGGNDVVKYGSKEKIFIPLEELISKYAPRLQEVVDLPNVKSRMTLPDGHIYSPPYPIPEPECIFGPWINKTWLDKLGLKMPTTMDELYTVLVAFRDKDPNGNGQKDEIPFSSRTDHFFKWFAMFGAPVPDSDLVMLDGKPTFTGTMDFYKDGINYFNKLYKEKLMDQELFTHDSAGYNGKGKAKDAAYGVCITYTPADISPGIDPATNKYTRLTDYVPLPPLKSAKCDKPMWARGSTGLTVFTSQLVVTDKAKNPATIIRWLDNLYQEDNSIQANMGVYNVTSKKNDDGTYEQLPKTDITGAPTYAEFIGAMPKYVPADIFNNKIKKNDAEAENYASGKALDTAWKDNMLEMNPPVWLSADESKQISTIQTDIKNFMQKKRAEWVTGSADVNKEWDDYKAQLDKLGLPKFMEVMGGAMQKSIDASK